MNRHQVHIHYLRPFENEPENLTVEPYFTEPNIMSHFSHIIGYCRAQKGIIILRMDCIVREITADNSITYKIPSNFDLNDYLNFGWGSCDCRKTEFIKLKFKAETSRNFTDTIWHHSQKVEVQSHGSLIMKLQVENSHDFRD